MRENQEKAVAYIDFIAAQIKSEPGDIYQDEIRISQEMKGYNPGLNKAYSDNTLISRHLFFSHSSKVWMGDNSPAQ
ncbi:hypothetical protein [Pantoea sp. Cy-640]|jgi:hypothetical protein|uniref:hypothetical protein n=1 Tax=Pantoea sp. Cy-640 TaxID=2608353 RepID=UPI00141A510A|nr:hypothetical protein [Pantoea sp. Cy-640]NIG14734.1 hypothetical protein [Pantoea sp. Cy-640]